MGRAERRRLEKQKGKQVKTYNLTRSQLHNAVRQVTEEDLKRIKQEAMEDAINTAMTLLLVLPMEVLMDHYWKKTYAKKIPEFTELVLQYYERWQNGELDMDEMKKDLWEYGGVMFGYVLLVILVTAEVTLAESFFNSFCSWIVRDWSFF